jgi:hypothetical protein
MLFSSHEKTIKAKDELPNLGKSELIPFPHIICAVDEWTDAFFRMCKSVSYAKVHFIVGDTTQIMQAMVKKTNQK